jgi:hypothetical protein
MPHELQLPEDLLQAIERRLRPVCAHLPEAELRQLVWRIAMIRWKYERLDREGRRRLDLLDLPDLERDRHATVTDDESGSAA